MSIVKLGPLAAAALLAASHSAAAQSLEQSMQKAHLAQACGMELKLSDAGCRCLTDRAMADLNDFQREYLIATAIAPSAAGRMRNKVSQEDIQILAKFLATAEKDCSTQ